MKNMSKNNIVKFKRTGNLYLVLECDCKMKHPESREWISAVIYQGYKIFDTDKYVDDPEKKIWIRELQDFTDKFEIYEDNYFPDLGCREFFETPDSILRDNRDDVDLDTPSKGKEI